LQAAGDCLVVEFFTIVVCFTTIVFFLKWYFSIFFLDSLEENQCMYRGRWWIGKTTVLIFSISMHVSWTLVDRQNQGF